MFFKKSLYFVFTVFVLCESSFLDNLGKCYLNDGDCQKDLIQSVIRDIPETGIPEAGFPQIDPITLTDISVSVLDVIDFNLIKGSVKGVKDCVINKVVTKPEKQHISIELTCDLSIKGHYKIFSNNGIFKDLFGAPLYGDGNGKVKIDKLKLRLNFYFSIQNRNGDTFITCKPEKTTYTYDIGKMTFAADNLYIGNTESSKAVTGLLNENWKILITPFSKPFMDKAMAVVYDFLHKFFDAVPSKYYLYDDLTPYVTGK